MSDEMTTAAGQKAARDRKAVFKGVMMMALSGMVIVVMHTLVRKLSTEVHPIEIAFFRNIVGFVMLLPFIFKQDRALWRSKQPKLQLFRSVIGTCALLSWFTSLSMLPVADATAISFVTVLFITIGAALFLGEKVGIRRWSAIIVGFVGTLIIVRPGSGVFGPGALVALASTVFWASAMICVKALSKTDSSVTVVFLNNVYMTFFSIIPALFVWTWPTWEQAGMMLIIGILATGAHVLLTQAMRHTDATIVAPVDYMRLLWAAALGFLVFGEFPDVWTWVGGTVIFLSTVYITYRESRKKAVVSAPAPPLET